jgi:hypothetical protein
MGASWLDVQRSGGSSEVNSTGPRSSWLNMSDKLPAYVMLYSACVANLLGYRGRNVIVFRLSAWILGR